MRPQLRRLLLRLRRLVPLAVPVLRFGLPLVVLLLRVPAHSSASSAAKSTSTSTRALMRVLGLVLLVVLGVLL